MSGVRPVTADVLFTGEGRPGFSWQCRRFVLLLFSVTFPASLESRDCALLSGEGNRVYLSTPHTPHLSGRAEHVGPREVEVADGRHGDRVVGVIVLHRLRRAADHVSQIVVFLWKTGDR